MDFFNQLKSLVGLPGALLRSGQAKAQQKQVEAQLANRTPSVVPQPTGGTSAPMVLPQAAPIQPPPSIDPTTGFNYGGPVASPTATNPFGQPSAPPVAGTNQPDLGGQLESIKSGLQGIQSGLQAQPQQEEINRRRAEDELLRGLQISPEEEQAQKQLNALIQSRELGLRGVEEKPIAMEFITGQKAAIERRAATQALPLTQNLALLQARRQAATDVAKTKLDITEKRAERAKPNEEKVDEFTNEKGERVIAFRDKNTGKIRQEILGISGATTQADRDRKIKTEVIKIARPLLAEARNKGNLLSSYMDLRNQYAEKFGDAKGFDDIFSVMLTPEQRRDLFGRPGFPNEPVNPFD